MKNRYTKSDLTAVANRLAKENRRLQREVSESAATIAMLAQQLADKKEIIRRLTT